MVSIETMNYYRELPRFTVRVSVSCKEWYLPAQLECRNRENWKKRNSNTCEECAACSFLDETVAEETLRGSVLDLLFAPVPTATLRSCLHL